MKSIASITTNINNSPKTPGGISKSLLTPCRRVGLSRNWKKRGLSPFISPLASTTEAEGSLDETGSKKRKEKILDEKCASPVSPKIDLVSNDLNIYKTPSRNIQLPRKKKSKTLISTINKEDTNTESLNISTVTENTDNSENLVIQTKNEHIEQFAHDATRIKKVSTPIQQISKSKIKKKQSQVKSGQDVELIKNESDAKVCNSEAKDCKENANTIPIKEISPKELKKECIVVIQKKIFKNEKKCSELPNKLYAPINEKQANIISQTLFDSDSDDLPLCQFNKIESQRSDETVTVPEDDDFIEHKSKIRKLDTVVKDKKKSDTKKVKKHLDNMIINKQEKIDSFDDDEDFDFDNKRTILIRKTYEKVTKPLKAKSTGSITQKDIDDLKSRIEVKKKVLLAKTLTEDTKELRDLIKKWQRGCQDALMELMDLMKKKFPEKSSMAYSEILQSLHIPASLVGYDSENDCFNTPDDASIVLSHVNNL